MLLLCMMGVTLAMFWRRNRHLEELEAFLGIECLPLFGEVFHTLLRSAAEELCDALIIFF
jgi:hypothetical protein